MTPRRRSVSTEVSRLACFDRIELSEKVHILHETDMRFAICSLIIISTRACATNTAERASKALAASTHQILGVVITHG